MAYRNNKWGGYNPQQNENERQWQLQEQELVVLSAYDKKIVHKTFRNTLEWLEKYIEVIHRKDYPDWQGRKKIHDNSIKRPDANNPEKVEGLFSAILFGFKKVSEDKPQFIRDELKEEFYQWSGATGVDINNCPPRLKNHLFEINEVLEGRGEKLERDVSNRKREIEPSSPEYGEALNRTFGNTLIPLENARNEYKSLKGQTHRDIRVGNNFGGNGKQAEQAFKQMSGQHDYQGFNFFDQKEQQKINPNYNPLIDDPMEEFEISSSSAEGSSQKSPQERTNSEIIWDVKNNPQNWRVGQVITDYDSFGRAVKKGQALIYYSAQVGHGGEVFGSQPVYLLDQKFSPEEVVEINQALNISENDENRQIIEEIKGDINSWKIEVVLGDSWLVHNQAQKVQSEVGSLLHPKQRFTDEEWAEIESVLNSRQSWGSRVVSRVLPANFGNRQNYKLVVEKNQSIANQPTKDNKGRVFGIIVAIFAVSSLLVGSIVVVKKRLNKVKK